MDPSENSVLWYDRPVVRRYQKEATSHRTHTPLLIGSLSDVWFGVVFAFGVDCLFGVYCWFAVFVLVHVDMIMLVSLSGISEAREGPVQLRQSLQKPHAAASTVSPRLGVADLTQKVASLSC